jgi:hypothetical protein
LYWLFFFCPFLFNPLASLNFFLHILFFLWDRHCIVGVEFNDFENKIMSESLRTVSCQYMYHFGMTYSAVFRLKPYPKRPAYCQTVSNNQHHTTYWMVNLCLYIKLQKKITARIKATKNICAVFNLLVPVYIVK